MSILKSSTTLVIIFMLSLFVVSCGGGGGGSGGGTSPDTGGNGDGEGNRDSDGDGNGDGGDDDGNGNGGDDDDDDDNDGNANMCPLGQTGTPPNCMQPSPTFDASGLASNVFKFTTGSTDAGGVGFIIERSSTGTENRRLYALVQDRAPTNNAPVFVVEVKGDPSNHFALVDGPELDQSAENGLTFDYVAGSRGSLTSTEYRFFRNVGISGATGNANRVFVEIRGSAIGSTAGYSDMDWRLGAYGPGLVALPTGTQSYTGATLSVQRTDYNGRRTNPNDPTRLGVSNRPFTMSVDFGNGSGNIANLESAPELLANQYDLVGTFTVDLTNGTFSVSDTNTMNIKRASDAGGDLPAEFYGTFHGPTGEGVTGVFHDAVDDPLIIGGILGSKQTTP